MNNYFQLVKQAFSHPTLNNKDELKDLRTAHPLELFFDLVFVAALASVGHYFHHPTFSSVIQAIILFTSIYLIWVNITNYNIYYFGNSYFIKFCLLITMIPVMFLISVDDVSSQLSIQVLAGSFALTRFSMAFIWNYSAVHRYRDIDRNLHQQDHHIYMRVMGRYLRGSFVISGFISLIPVFKPDILLTCLLLSILTEFGIKLICNHRLKRYDAPFFDFDLLKERHLLFVILVWGEGLMTIINQINWENNPLYVLISTIILFLILFSFFIRAVEEFDIYNYYEKNQRFFEINNGIFPFLTLALFVSLSMVVAEPHVHLANRIIIIICLIYIVTSHIIFNNQIKKKQQTDSTLHTLLFDEESIKIVMNENYQKYLAIDLRLLYIQFVLVIVLIFVQSSLLFVLITLIFFLLHIAAVPYRYYLFAD